MSEVESGIVALILAVLAGWLGYKTVEAYLASPNPWLSFGVAVLAFAVLFLLWALLGAAALTGIDLAKKTVKKLEEEEDARNWWKFW